MALKGKAVVLTTSDQDIYTCPATLEASAHALVFSNTSASGVAITVKIYEYLTNTTTTVMDGKVVSAEDTYSWPKPINLSAGDKIVASAATGAVVSCVVSAYQNSATPAAVGFTPRGAWSSGSNYVVNDVVSYNGSSYLAIQASTNQNPSSATAYWMIQAAKGDTGAAGTGSGDVSGPASSIDSEIALFDSTTGKLIKRATTSGILKGTSGVLSAATAGTDYAGMSTDQTFTGSQRGAVTTANTGSFDMNAANNFICTPTGTVTLTFTNITAGQSGYVTLVNGSNYTISKAAAVKVATGVLTAISATGTYQLSYFSPDGTNVYLTASGALS